MALYSSLKRFRRMHGPGNQEFAAHIAFYAPCNTSFLEDEEVSDRPIRLFHGSADDYVSVEPCRNYVERLRRRGKDVQLTEYARAQHAFDNPMYCPAVLLPAAVTAGRCQLEEGPKGEIMNVATGKPASSADACVSLGATVEYDAAATAEASKAVTAFVAQLFSLKS